MAATLHAPYWEGEGEPKRVGLRLGAMLGEKKKRWAEQQMALKGASPH